MPEPTVKMAMPRMNGRLRTPDDAAETPSMLWKLIEEQEVSNVSTRNRLVDDLLDRKVVYQYEERCRVEEHIERHQ